MWLRYAPWRVSCRQCGVRVEQVSWAVGSSAFTAPFEELTAYLAQVTDRTTASRLAGISWQAVGSIVERVVARRLDSGRFDELTRIGVDEFSYRKRHHYLTVVVDHDRRRVVWAGGGRSAETLHAFFDRLGPDGCARIALVAEAPGAAEAGRGAASGDASPAEPDAGPRLRVEKLPGHDPGTGSGGGRACVARQVGGLGARSRLRPFILVARTIRKHAAGILGYLDTRLTNGPVEGINNKLRVIARRAYGFHTPGALISMLFLCCGGIELAPPLPTRV